MHGTATHAPTTPLTADTGPQETASLSGQDPIEARLRALEAEIQRNRPPAGATAPSPHFTAGMAAGRKADATVARSGAEADAVMARVQSRIQDLNARTGQFNLSA